MPKVDVIIPAYNAAKYLAAALESVIAQTFEDWKILLIDDGSTDNTAEVVAPFIERLGPKLQYISKPNGGLPAARNTAIRNSSSEFLALLDADDIWLPSRLTELLRCFDDRPRVGLAYGLISWIDADGMIIDTFSGNRNHVEGRIATHIYTRKVHLPCPTVTFRRSCVDEVGLFDETMRATEDRDLWLRIALRYEVAFVPKVLALYRLSAGSMSTDPGRMLKAQLQFVEKHYGAPGCGRVARRVALGEIYKHQAELLKGRGDSWGCIRNSLRSLALYPFDLENIRIAGSLVLRSVGIKK
jgi:glycosyltransferase involved in cell wall biosynthesis